MNRKLTMMSAALLLASSVGFAESYSPGNRWNNLPSPNYGYSVCYPVDLSEELSASQTIFSADELAGLAPVTASNGATTVSTISAVSFPIGLEMSYAMEGAAEFKVYLREYDDVTFPKVGANMQWLSYMDEGVSGSYELNGADDDFMEAAMSGEPYILTVNLDEALEYHGNSLVLTVLCTNSLEDMYGMDWYAGSYYINPNMGVSRTRSGNTDSHNLTGNLKNSSAQVPVVNFTYTPVTKEPESAETFGEPTTYLVGPYNSASTGSESAGTILPADLSYTNSFSQALYSPAELSGLYSNGADGLNTAEIESLTFKMDMGYDYYSGQSSFKVYIQNVEESALPVMNGKTQWMAVDESIFGTFTTEEYEFEELFEEMEFTVNFNEKLRYAGNGLLVTFVTESTLEGMGGGAPLGLTFNGSGKQSAVKSSYSAVGLQTGDASNVSRELPVLKLGIIPVHTQSATIPVMLENVVPAVSRVTVDPTLSGLDKVEEANAISLSFDVVDQAAAGSYDIYMGNNKLGTITGTHGVISLLSLPANDLLLGVAPAGQKVSEGGSISTIAKADFDALFPAPEVTVGSTAMHATYKVHDDKSDIEAIASFNFSTTVPVVRMKGTPTNAQTKVVTSSMNWDLPESFGSYLPTGAYDDYAANEGRISYYKADLVNSYINLGEIESPATANMTVGFYAAYPVIVQTSPLLGDALPEEGDYNITSATGRSLQSVNRDYDNGSSYSYGRNQCTAVFNVDADTEFTFVAEYPERFTYKENSRSNALEFYAPEGHTIHYSFTPAEAPAEPMRLAAEEDELPSFEWTSTDSNIWSHDLANAGVLTVRTVNADSEQVAAKQFAISADGKVKEQDISTGVDAIEAVAGEAQYFNLQGVRVAEPESGIYIRIYNGKSEKVMK